MWSSKLECLYWWLFCSRFLIMQPMNGRRSSGPQKARRDYFPRQNSVENAEIISYVCESE